MSSAIRFWMEDSMKLGSVLLILILIAVVAFFAYTYKRWEGTAPTVAFDRDFKALGRNAPFKVTVQDAGTGLKHVIDPVQAKGQGNCARR